MNSTRHSVSWETLVSAARGHRRTDDEPSPHADEEFVRRVRGLRGRLWALARLLLWRRWAVIFGIVAAAAYFGCHLVMRESADPSIPLPVVPFPVFP